MSAFSSFPFHLVDSVYFHNFPTKMSGFSQEPNNTIQTLCFPKFHHQSGVHQRSVHDSVRESTSFLEQSNTKISFNNEQRINIINNNNNNKQSTDSSSMVLEKVESGEQVTQKLASMDNKRKFKQLNSAQSKDARDELGRSKKEKKKNNNGSMKRKDEKKMEEGKLEEKEAYIHVRARRGQATDSHSLAERVRREKITERMKLLQSLVPGCDKVTGKALMLDEIINYVQSMQNQVEFLSTKLASLNPLFFDFGMEQSSPNQSTGMLINNNYQPVLDTSLVFQQGQMPNIFSQEQVHHFQSNGEMLWNVDEERQSFNNQCGLINNFH